MPFFLLQLTVAFSWLHAWKLRGFNTFKKLLTNALMLHFPDLSIPCYVATDASNVGVAAVLYRRVYDEDKKKWSTRYISFMAHSFQERER